MRHILPLVAVVFFGMPPLDALAGEEIEPDAPDDRAQPSLHLFVENDGGLIKRNSPSDEKFSSGVGAAWTHRPAWAESLDAWADNAFEAMPLFSPFGAERTGAGYFAAQRIFTPSDITIEANQPNEHPWAGHLFGGVYFDRTDGRSFERWRADVGATGGPSGAEQSQELIHEFFDDEDPAGWDNQIKAEPTLQFRYRREWRLPLSPGDWEGRLPPLRAELMPGARLDLGTVRVGAAAGAVMRLGWHIPDGFNGRTLSDLPDASAHPARGFVLYGRAGGQGEVIAHDLILDGGTLRDTEGVGLDAEPLVGTLLGGAAFGYVGERWALRFSYTQRFRSRNFEEASGGHAWASAHVALTARF